MSLLVPETAEEARAMIETTRQEQRSLRIVSRSGDGREGISCEKLNEWLFFDEDDMVLGVGAGMKLRDLHARLAKHRMRLRINGWFEHDTIGSAFATHRVGPDRTFDGGIRDSVIGIRYVDGLSRLVKAGGRVVKNVTGYDLMRMMLGSRGGLGLITALHFKMMPMPLDATTLIFEGDLKGFLNQVRQMNLQRLPLDWCAIRGVLGKVVMALGISGNQARRERLIGDLRKISGREVALFTEDETPEEYAWVAPEQRLSACLHELKVHEHSTHLHVRLPHAVLLFPEPQAWLSRACSFQLHPFSADFHLLYQNEPEEFQVRNIISGLEEHDGHLWLEKVPASWRSMFQECEPMPPGFALMQALKKNLDPDGVFDAPFYAGLK